MNRRMKSLTMQSILPSLLAVASLAGVSPSAQGVCLGFPESTGCIVNGVANRPCVGTLGTGNIIEGGFCINPAASPFAGTANCVIRGLAGNDHITTSRTFQINVICGGGGNDIIQGDTFTDILFGEVGLDILIGGGGFNLLNGGPDNDTLLTGGGFSATNVNFGGVGPRDVCEAGSGGFNAIPECEVSLP